MTPTQALAFVEQHGIVLEAARRGAVPSLADAITGESLRGNWWSHPRRGEIFTLTRAVREAPHILTCRIVDGRVSFVHERLWPALARLALRFPHENLARLHEVHSARGTHRIETIPFPHWLPVHVATAAGRMDEAEARASLPQLLPAPDRGA
jgi:hypothetical protein